MRSWRCDTARRTRQGRAGRERQAREAADAQGAAGAQGARGVAGAQGAGGASRGARGSWHGRGTGVRRAAWACGLAKAHSVHSACFWPGLTQYCS